MSMARRYAKALFEVALKENNLQRVQEDLHHLDLIITQTTALKELFNNPFVKPSIITNILTVLGEKATLSDLSKKFLTVLFQNRRLKYISKVIGEFRKQKDAAENALSGEVTTVCPLTPQELGRLTDILSEKLKGTVRLKEVLNPDLLGGFQVNVGPYLIDASLKTQLNKLHIALKE